VAGPSDQEVRPNDDGDHLDFPFTTCADQKTALTSLQNINVVASANEQSAKTDIFHSTQQKKPNPNP